jgi:hypothetical protein
MMHMHAQPCMQGQGVLACCSAIVLLLLKKRFGAWKSTAGVPVGV